MQAVTKFFAGSQEVDVQKSVQASIEASTAPFTIEELAEAIICANPQDEYIQNVEQIIRQIRRFVDGCHTNRYTGSMYICDALGDGRYVRHGVAIEEPKQAESVVEQVVEEVKQEAVQEVQKAVSEPAPQVQVGETSVWFFGSEINRWRKAGHDRLYLQKGGFIDLRTEESIQAFFKKDAYGWSSSCIIERGVKVGFKHIYRESEIIVRWA